MPSLPITEYARDIDKIDSASATEFTYRTPLEKLLSETVKELEAEYGVLEVLHEPQRESGIGAPDFLIRNASGAAVGYVECKKFGESLKSHLGKSQLEKYRNLSPNIILTNYQDFYLLRDNKIVLQKELGDTAATRKEVAELIKQFLSAEAQPIGNAKILAAMLAERCALLRKGLEEKLPNDNTNLHGLFKAFQETIYRDIDIPQFADALAQTLVYGLLLAKLKAPPAEKLDLYNIEKHVPQNFALVREITGFLKTLDDRNYADIKYLVENILAVINGMDVAAVNEDMSYRRQGIGEQDDPYLYFYETFLAAYDSEMRESRGVYYTPPPVVRFIVRATDDILRRDFALTKGIASNTVTALDFATGTGTFLLEMMRLVFGNKDAAKRDLIAHSHLLKNFYGFEYLIAPYTIAHLKLSQFLTGSDVSLREDERINVFLTNTLDDAKEIEFPLLKALTEEAKRAREIKNQPILIITGNPPYSGISQNKGKWITGLIEDYKYVDGKSLGERNSKWLQDDYVKFIRFAQWKIAKAGQGIVAIITNHAFLDNVTFRGMRQSLLNTFDHLYFLNLHGNSNQQERTPDGDKDENVFDIQQGVAVSLLVKNKKLSKKVFYTDFWGTRENKYELCETQTLSNITNWKEIKPVSPFYLFIPHNSKAAAKYEKFYSIVDIFPANVTGIVTARDSLCIGFTDKDLRQAVSDFHNLSIPDKEICEKYSINDNYQWKVAQQRQIFSQESIDTNLIQDICYRPFDVRRIYYDGDIVFRKRAKIMFHMLAGNNTALVSVRQVAENAFNHVFIADKIMDFRATLSNKGGAYLFPLYRYHSEINKIVRRENFNPKFRKWIDDRYGKRHTPEDILGCIYAILHSPDYRRRYAEFLRLDFPRIPFPMDNAEFMRLAKIGKSIIAAHLLRENCDGDIELRGSGTTHIAGAIRYHDKDRHLHFNADEYLAPVSPEVFNFHIGGYQPLDKFLKSRKGRDIRDDIPTLEKAANAIAFTLAQMKKIDK